MAKYSDNPAEIREDEIVVKVTGDLGIYLYGWKKTADRRDAIRWTLESGDLPYYAGAGIMKIEIIEGEMTI
jgi:hypothetical protein